MRQAQVLVLRHGHLGLRKSPSTWNFLTGAPEARVSRCGRLEKARLLSEVVMALEASGTVLLCNVLKVGLIHNLNESDV